MWITSLNSFNDWAGSKVEIRDTNKVNTFALWILGSLVSNQSNGIVCLFSPNFEIRGKVIVQDGMTNFLVWLNYPFLRQILEPIS